MEDLLSKEHYCSKIHTLIMKKVLDSPFYDFLKISIPLNKTGGSHQDGCNEMTIMTGMHICLHGIC